MLGLAILRTYLVALAMALLLITQNAKACGGDDAVYEEVAQTPTVEISL